jgi:hypothetical protein
MRMGKVDIVTLTYLGWCVTEDDGLRYGKRVVKVAQRVKLPVFLFNSDEEFLKAFHFITLDKDLDGVGHEYS